MINEMLLKWLNGKRSFTVGKVLYSQFGNDDAVKTQLALGLSEYTESLLLDSINAIVNGEQQKAPVTIISSYDAMPDSADQVLQSLRFKWLPMFTEMNYKRHALDRLLDDPFEISGIQRGKLAKEIIDLEQKCIHVWQNRDYYIKHGSLPGKSIDKDVIIDGVKAGQRMENLKIYIRRYKNYLAADPGNAKAAELLNKYSDELTELVQAHG